MVCYLGSPISYAIAKRVIKIKYISLVNLIMDKPVVKELIQNSPLENCIAELDRILNNKERQRQLKQNYKDLKTLFSQGGRASAKAAEIVYETAGKEIGPRRR